MKKKIDNYNIKIGSGLRGKLNKITDVPGVKVGHYTVSNSENNTGITIILPSDDNLYVNKTIAASHVINGYGKTMGLVQIDELGYIETPIALTNTLNIGKVHDGVVDYMIKETKKLGINITTLNPVVGECNDYYLNNIQNRCLESADVTKAIMGASKNFEEGDVGAGKGTVCCGLKGGIGSASRIIKIGRKSYTIGVLVQTNFGGSEDLIIDGNKVGGKIKESIDYFESDKGSIMIIVATDLPVNERQLKRIIKRSVVGLAKTGSYIAGASGDVVIGFTTANRIRHSGITNYRSMKIIAEKHVDKAFRAVADATEEAILNSLLAAETTIGFNDNKIYSINDVWKFD